MSTQKSTILVLCGNNLHNQFGIYPNNASDSQLQSISRPYKSNIDVSNLLSYSIFDSHAIYVNNDGDAYGIGIDDFKKDSYIVKSHGKKCKIFSVVCGINYSVFLITNQDGHNMLGFINPDLDKTIHPINIKSRQPISLFGGALNAAAIDDEGAIILITDIQLNNIPSKSKALFLPMNDKAVNVACCNFYYIALGESGTLYYSSAYDDICFSVYPNLDGKKFIDISGTHDRCYALCEDGKVYMCKENDNEYSSDYSDEYNIINVSYFKIVTSLNKYNISAVYAGYEHGLFQTTEGQILAIGFNACGELMNSNLKRTFNSPIKTCINKDASFCIAGKYVSAVFIGDNIPPNMPNRKIRYNDTFSITIGGSNDDDDNKSESSVSSNYDNLSSFQKQIERIRAENLILQEKINRMKDENDVLIKSQIKVESKEVGELKQKYEKNRFDELDKAQYEQIIKELKMKNMIILKEKEQMVKEYNDYIMSHQKNENEYHKKGLQYIQLLENEISEKKLLINQLNGENNMLRTQNAHMKKDKKLDMEIKDKYEELISKYEASINQLQKENFDLKALIENRTPSDAHKIQNMQKEIESLKMMNNEVNEKLRNNISENLKLQQLNKDLKFQHEKEKENSMILMEKIKLLENEKNEILKTKNINQLAPMKKTEECYNLIIEDDQDNFENLGYIDEGATSIAYKIFDKKASKILCKKIVKQINNEAKFNKIKNAMKEYEVLIKMNHPSICNVYGYNLEEKILNPISVSDKQKTTIALYLEYLPYKLKEHLKTKIMNNSLKTKIALEVAFGMMYIHKNNIIHRDLKIENILLNSVFEAKIIDFDQCHIDEMSEDSETLTKGIGTKCYMSPEMANEEDYNNSTDVYSYGIVLFILFTGENPKQSVKDKLNKKPLQYPKPSQLISQNCIELIKMCTLVNKDERPSFEQIIDYMYSKKFMLASEVDFEIIQNRYQILMQFSLESSSKETNQKTTNQRTKNVIQKPVVKKKGLRF